MDLDNPSYFSVAGSPMRAPRCYLRSSSSTSADSNQELLIMGEPRLSDIAPDLAQHHLEDPIDEVFVEESGIGSVSTRRHSVGAFAAAERRGSTGVFREEVQVPQVPYDDHALRHASFPRRRCPRCTKAPPQRPANMDDILIVSLKTSEPASLWADYFANYFQQISKANRKPFKILHASLHDPLGDEPQVQQRAASVKLQLVVVCPAFLDFVDAHPESCASWGRLLLPDRTLALLLGVADGDVTQVHRRAFPGYAQWQRLSVGKDQDEGFAREFLGQAMGILSRVWKQQSSVSQEKTCFSVSPKKIRQGQNSVFILLTHPLQKDDVLKVSIERNDAIFEVKTIKRRNPYTVKVSVPNALTETTSIVNILVEKNGNIVGSRPIKCESRLRELEQILRLTDHPIEFMCQTMGFAPASREQLDNWLLQAFQRNLPAHFGLLANHESPFAAAVHAHKHSHEEYPTLLHFAAKFGFEKLALQLLDCPGADVAYDVRNVQGMTPAEMAERGGHVELASTLRGYMSMNEFTCVYSKLKEMSLDSAKIDPNSYVTPKVMEELYKVCPPPRPIEEPVVTPSSEYGYMAMNPPIKITIEKDSPTSPSPQTSVVEDKVQKELLEIINDFKNNVHSIAQVEKLVDEWKNRNDVQKSFQEKQDQLREMRLRYEKIQHEMKQSMKKATPFDRVKKLFGRSKSKEEKHEISSPVLASPSIVAIQTQRPISSLSTSSSGSSGRMSTISGCSLGDSGTHSDNEERKNMLGSHNEDDFRNVMNKAALELNYTPVPTPKPIKNGLFTNRNPPFETIEEKPMARPDTLPIKEEYYIQFPPSGLPIEGLQEIEQEYMNVDAGRSEGGTHEYMNFKVMKNKSLL